MVQMVPFPVGGKLCIPAHPNPFLLSAITSRLSPFPIVSFVTKEFASSPKKSLCCSLYISKSHYMPLPHCCTNLLQLHPSPGL